MALEIELDLIKLSHLQLNIECTRKLVRNILEELNDFKTPSSKLHWISRRERFGGVLHNSYWL